MEGIEIECNEHPEKKAIAICLGCHKGLCEDCRQFYLGKSVCQECFNAIKKQDIPDTSDDLISTIEDEFSQAHEKLNDFIQDQKIEDNVNKLKNEADEFVEYLHSRFKVLKLSGSKDEGYLICESCSGYYKLEKGESLEDFESCECGGKLNFSKTLDH